MVNLNIKVNTKEDKVDATLGTEGASLADLAITERILRRYLKRVIMIADGLLDKDTDKEKRRMRVERSPELESLRLPHRMNDQKEVEDDSQS